MSYLKSILVRIALTGVLVLFSFSFFGAQLKAHDGPHVTVSTGDTLSTIAATHEIGVAELMKLNRLSDPNDIWIGQELALPKENEPREQSDTEVAAQPTEDFDSALILYKAESGETLVEVALKNQVGLALLAELNQISWNQRLYTNQPIRIPDQAQVSRSQFTSTGVVPLSRIHIVQTGEILTTIADRYGTTSRALSRANRLTNESLIIPGQKLKIPVDLPYETVDLPAPIEVDPTTFPTTTEKWIDVNLSTQVATAYVGTEPVKAFLVSTGKAKTPTVQGVFRIWATTPVQDMSGGSRAAGTDYYLEDVEHVQYFFEDYAFHAAYWHDNFGQPMSRGCVNMRPDDARWLFDWASPDVSNTSWTYLDQSGTLVWVHE